MSNQTTIDYRPAVLNKRIETSYTIEIASPPQKIFPLACPVEEKRWIPDWDYKLIYSKSGVNEPGCIFTEDILGPHIFGKPLLTMWVTTIHDPLRSQVHFQLNTAGKAVIQLEIKMREVGENITSCCWNMVFTALEQEANDMNTDTIHKKLDMSLIMLASALKHYCETGKMIQ